jgi:hypothetical protein
MKDEIYLVFETKYFDVNDVVVSENGSRLAFAFPHWVALNDIPLAPQGKVRYEHIGGFDFTTHFERDLEGFDYEVQDIPWIRYKVVDETLAMGQLKKWYTQRFKHDLI